MKYTANAKTLFHDPKSFVTTSAHMAQFLYNKKHACAGKGRRTVRSPDKRSSTIENDFVQAVGISKSESKESFLKVFEHGQSFELSAEDGININKLDKGCLVFKTMKQMAIRYA
jgi:hypothetical protein